MINVQVHKEILLGLLGSCSQENNEQCKSPFGPRFISLQSKRKKNVLLNRSSCDEGL